MYKLWFNFLFEIVRIEITQTNIALIALDEDVSASLLKFLYFYFVLKVLFDNENKNTASFLVFYV